MGNKIIEGFLSTSLKTFSKYIKNFKHVASFSILQKGKSGKFEIGYCKVPFAREEELKDFEKTFNEVINLLTPSTSTETNEKSKNELKNEK